ncbi:MAG: sodium:proton antiporter [Planctomycetia bacterium]|nr:sodium:proton antiporter [Planctomycetia bacterium]
MLAYRMFAGAIGVLFLPEVARAAGDGLDLPVWTALPFIILLLAIALLPLLAPHLWHTNRNRALITAPFVALIAGYLIWIGPATNGRSVAELEHRLKEYGSFIILLAALYVVSGGITITGRFRPTPFTNAGFLTAGALLANLIGTTGASMLLIRPVLQINRPRRHTGHLPLFFIFLVSNLGGLLTPLGDPPLFLGFLQGVPFEWTLRLWPHWLLVNGVVLVIFLIWDVLAWRREEPLPPPEATAGSAFRVQGWVNVPLLGAILLLVLFQAPHMARLAAGALDHTFACPDLTLHFPMPEIGMLAVAGLSLLLTPGSLRAANDFSWAPIAEVAILFIGIFVTMTPVLAMLQVHGPAFGIAEPWQFFWITGALSSFLDNAPTYLTIGTLAASPHDLAWLAHHRPSVLAAISCGAVFMGANTYIGNGPNFMVKAIADEAGYRTPSFFGYLIYSGLILLPTFALITGLFFR